MVARGYEAIVSFVDGTVPFSESEDYILHVVGMHGIQVCVIMINIEKQ